MLKRARNAAISDRQSCTMWLMSDLEAVLFVAAITAMVLLAQLV
jgi:hypothetical protein